MTRCTCKSCYENGVPQRNLQSSISFTWNLVLNQIIQSENNYLNWQQFLTWVQNQSNFKFFLWDFQASQKLGKTFQTLEFMHNSQIHT